ncbi:hypothetical protein D1007_56637 [Hordeum vulgare]|nr:hypothetical protein D1007_56637 [Hordeum vulgare]
MDQSITWQKAVQDLAGNNQKIREQLREITGWFPSIEMMRNYARGLIKVMREDEKLRAFHRGYCIPPSSVLLWAMWEPGPTRLASRERVTDAILALPAVVLDPEVQIIPRVFTGGNKKKKPVVRHSERLKNLKNN